MRLSTILVIISAITFTLCTLPEAQAEKATDEEMELVCQNWLAYMVFQRGGWAGETNPSVVEIQEIVWEDTVLARCFSIAPQGHVVVPTLKELPPIKAYSERCGLDVNQTVGFSQLLREVLLHRIRLFIKTYGTLDANQPYQGDVVFGRVHRQEWDRFLVSREIFRAELLRDAFDPLTEVGPLLTTNWDQNSPYNNICPMGEGGRCLVGCTATATAQILKYHNWPPTGTGSHSYLWGGEGSVLPQMLSADFRDSLDWANMPDSCTIDSPQVQQDAVAELCYELGVAFEMDYGHSSSGASTHNVLTALPSYFRYDGTIVWEDREQYSSQTWFNLITAEINLGRPMLYAMQLLFGAHAVVCDGWRDTGGSNQVHLNYGWANPNTTWYTIDNISSNPDQEELVRNIFPCTGLAGALEGTLGPGTYHVCAPISVNSSTALTIEPGTTLIFDEPYPFEIHGALWAYGTETDSIIFTADTLTNPDGWRGLRFSGPGSLGELDYCVIENSRATDTETFGGGVYFENSFGRFNNCTIRNNSADDYGGGVYFDSSGGIFTNCTIINNSAQSYHGGGVYCDNSSMPFFYNCIISGNSADSGDGGGVYCLNSAPSFWDNCIISNNFAAGGGGGVFCRQSSPVFSHSTISNNSADDGGGVYCFNNSSAYFDSCTVSVNWADSGDGGGVYCRDSSPEFHNNSTISGNTAYSNGGGVYCYQSSPRFWNDCIISGNLATYGSGGGVYCYNQSSPDFYNNCIISDNLAGDDGGGVYCTFNSSPTFTNCTISHNPVPGDGGGVYCGFNSSPHFTNGCVISYNSANHGGGVYCDQSSLQFTNSTINNNSADFGGGLYLEDNSAATCSGCTIRDNDAGDDGGGVYCLSSSSVTFTSTVIKNNSSVDDGGGVYCSDSSPTFSNCSIDSNSAMATGASGGGMYCIFNSSPACTSCTFVANWADDHGGGVYCDNSSPSFTNCKIIDNFANEDGGGLYCRNNSSPNVVHCTFSDNLAIGTGGGVYCYQSSPVFNSTILAFSIGSGLYFHSSATSTVEFCDIYGNSGGNIVYYNNDPFQGPSGIGLINSINAIGEPCDTYSNIFQNPRFANIIANDYSLLSWSHCVGSADSTSPPSPDIEGNQRPNPPGSKPDIGAYENVWHIPVVQGSLYDTVGSRIYPVVDSIFIASYNSLCILPGTTFRFDGALPFNISGTLMAEGTASDSIIFTADVVTNPSLWRGLRFYSGSANSQLSHCLIENGLAAGSGHEEYGGGVYCEGTSLTFTNCDIINNSADAYGGGVYCTDSDSSTFTDCNVVDNEANNRGGGVYCHNAAPTFTNCHIDSNNATAAGGSGGGIYCNEASPTFAKSTINDNIALSMGGGISCNNSSWATFDSCTISGDSADFGGGIYVDMLSYPLFDNCTIVNNEASFDGGAVCGSADFMSCIICDNEAINGGAIVSGMGLFEDCIIRHNEAVDGGAVFCSEGAYPDFWRCRIDSNTASSDGGGIFCIGLSSPTFTNCTIIDNSALTGSGGGLYCWTGTDTTPNPSFTYCTFNGNSVNFSPFSRRGGGVYCNNSPPIFNSTIIAFSQGDGIYFQSSPGCSVAYCDIYGNIPINIGNPMQGPLPTIGPPLIRTNANGDPCDRYFNIFLNPEFADTGGCDFHLNDSSHCIGAAQATGLGDDVERNLRPNPPGSLPDIGAYESPLGGPVGPLCGRLYGTLGPATYHVACSLYVIAGDTLRIMPGTTFIFDGYYQFDIYGTLLAEGTETDSIIFTTDTLANPSRWKGLRFHNPSSSGSQLAYCLIEYGLASGSFPNNRGGGVWCDFSSPTFTNCTIRYNSAIDPLSFGGGVHCENNSSPEFFDCRIDSNSAIGGGACSIFGSLPTFTNCTFCGNSASLGGGMYCNNSSPPINNCTFDDNTAASGGGGVYCDNGSSPPFTNCVIINNTSLGDGGGVYCYNFSASFTGCTIADNSASGNGGGVYCGVNASPNFTNCTIVDNLTGGNGGGVFCMILAIPTFNSTIIAFSTGSGIHFEMINQGSTVRYCDIFGNSGGDIANPSNGPVGIGQITTTNFNGDPCDQDSNIFLDPVFVDLAARDFHLLANSPCIDGGDPTLPYDPDGTITDIGVFYYHQNPGGIPKSIDDLVIILSGDNAVLSWSPVTEDTSGNPITVDYYQIYRDTNAVFMPSGMNLIDSTATTTFTDPAILATPVPAYFYNVTAISLHRNEN